MHAFGSPYAFIAHRSSPAFFLARTAQHVESRRLARDLARAAAALLALVGWCAVVLLVAG